MKIKTLSSVGREHEFGGMLWKLAYHGSAIDQRSRAAIEMTKATSSSTVLMQYLTEQPDRLYVDGKLVGNSTGIFQYCLDLPIFTLRRTDASTAHAERIGQVGSVLSQIAQIGG